MRGLGRRPKVLCFVWIVILFYDNEYFVDKGRTKATTLGGEPERKNLLGFGYLVGHFNYEEDIALSMQYRMTVLTASDNLTTQKMLDMVQHYRDSETKVEYAPIPNSSDLRFNSNSFANGLLSGAGLNVAQPLGWFPGWEKPLPGNLFGI